MVQIVEQTDLEQYEMYMKSTKSELVKMLIQANKYLDRGITIQEQDISIDFFVDTNSKL